MPIRYWYFKTEQYPKKEIIFSWLVSVDFTTHWFKIKCSINKPWPPTLHDNKRLPRLSISGTVSWKERSRTTMALHGRLRRWTLPFQKNLSTNFNHRSIAVPLA